MYAFNEPLVFRGPSLTRVKFQLLDNTCNINNIKSKN